MAELILSNAELKFKVQGPHKSQLYACIAYHKEWLGMYPFKSLSI